MKVKMLKPYGLLTPGTEVEVRDTVGVLWVGRKVAVEVKAPEVGAVAKVTAQFSKRKR